MILRILSHLLYLSLLSSQIGFKSFIRLQANGPNQVTGQKYIKPQYIPLALATGTYIEPHPSSSAIPELLGKPEPLSNNMVEYLSDQKWTSSNNRSSAPSKHIRSQSTPYFQHTRSFTLDPLTSTNEFGSFQNPILSPVTSNHISAKPMKQNPGRLQRHNRSLTTNTVIRPPLVTTDIRIESVPAALPSSIFSGSSPIRFDLSPPESPSLLPAKDKWNFIPNFKIDKESTERSPSPSRISTWFQGESAPINFGLVPSPTREASNPFHHSSTLVDSKSILESSRATKPSNFFSSFFAGKAVTLLSLPPDTNEDEFFNLDIKSALQPHVQADPFLPSSLKTFQLAAEGLIARIHFAYRQKVFAINDIRAEQEVQKEGLEEAQTRAYHLKTQLDSLGRKVDGQNNEILRLVRELRGEKRLRQEEEERNRTIRFVNPQQLFDRRTRSRGSTASTPSMLSDTDSIPSDLSDPLGHDNSSTASSPLTPRPILWPQNRQLSLASEQKLFEQTTSLPIGVDLEVVQENTELRSRIGHLEKELDSCLEILRGFGF